MSTKFILDSGRAAVHTLLLKHLKPFIMAQIVVNTPETLLEPELLMSMVDAKAIPLADELVESLTGNAEGANDVLNASIAREKAKHNARVKARQSSFLHEMIDELFNDPKSPDAARRPGTATAQAKPAKSPRETLAEMAKAAKSFGEGGMVKGVDADKVPGRTRPEAGMPGYLDDLLKTLGLEGGDVHAREIDANDPKSIERALNEIGEDIRRGFSDRSPRAG